MILKVGEEYIDEQLSISIEKRNKILSSLDSAVGDFSYSFDIKITAQVKRIFGINNLSDQNKFIGFDASILTNQGISIYAGQVLIDAHDDISVKCSFYSGNANWIPRITGTLQDLDLSYYDVETAVSASNILATWSNTEGVIFPIFDKGALINRRSPSIIWNVNLAASQKNQQSDFKAFIFVKTVMNKIFSDAGLKLSGTLVKNPIYNNLITTNNSGDTVANEISTRTTKARNNTNQGITTSYVVIDFDDITSFGYSDGSKGLYQTLTYIADIDMYVNVEAHIILSTSKTITVQSYRNGTTDTGTRSGTGTVLDFNFLETSSLGAAIFLNAGDFLQLRVLCSTGTANVLTDSWLKITPVLFPRVFPASLLSTGDKIDFVSDIFSMFNVIPSYDVYSDTVTANLFKEITFQSEIDLSEYIDSYEVDTTEIAQEFAKKNVFKYNDSDDELIEEYNNTYNTDWAAGNITSDNKLEAEKSLIELSFVPPWVYFHSEFSAQLPRAKYLDLSDSEDSSGSITSVTDNSGTARFNTTSSGVLSVGDIVRIYNMSNEYYNGYWVVSTVFGGSYFECYDAVYVGNDSGNFSLTLYEELTSDNQIIAILVQDYQGKEIKVISPLSAAPFTEYPLAVFHQFNFPNTVNTIKTSLAFGLPQNDDSLQISMIDQFYADIKNISALPVLIIAQMFIPESVFLSLNSYNPIRLITKDFNERFYLESITDYQASHLPCEVRLIKI